jgi:hypothetical protein
MPSNEEERSEVDVEELIAEVEQLTPEERATLRERLNEEPSPPLAGWSPDPLKLKVALNHLVDVGETTREDLAEVLSAVGEISEITSMDYGLVGRKSNDIFHVEKGDSKAEDRLSLTTQGRQLAEMFDDEFDGLRPVEKTLYRGLSVYGHLGAFLGILERHRQQDGHPDGMLKEDLVEEMAELYGGEADTFTGYLGTLCNRLELITRTRDGNRARYKIAVPERW